MPLAITPLGVDIPPEPEAPKIYSERYRHDIVDSAYQPETSILTMVEGAPRRVEWYNPSLGASEEPGSWGPSNAPVYQSYVRIKNVIIKQEGDGNYEYDPVTGQSDKTYNGFISFDVVPVIGSVFIADIGDGNAGLFNITAQPEIRNFTANKVYYIAYQLVGILTQDWFNMLETRVVDEKVYSKDSALLGGISVVTTGDFQDTQDVVHWLGTISSYLFRTFYWNPENTFVFDSPLGGGDKVYDEYLVNFLCAMITPDMRGTYPIINQFSTRYGGREFGFKGDINIWEVLLRGDWNLLPLCNNKASIIETTRLINTRLYGNLRSSKIRWFVATDPERFLVRAEYFNIDGYPILRPSAENNITYLFSEEFYKGTPVDPFEVMITETLQHHVVDRKKLLTYCRDTYFTLSPQLQLYHGAILLLLLHASQRVRPLI